MRSWRVIRGNAQGFGGYESRQELKVYLAVTGDRVAGAATATGDIAGIRRFEALPSTELGH